MHSNSISIPPATIHFTVFIISNFTHFLPTYYICVFLHFLKSSIHFSYNLQQNTIKLKIPPIYLFICSRREYLYILLFTTTHTKFIRFLTFFAPSPQFLPIAYSICAIFSIGIVAAAAVLSSSSLKCHIIFGFFFITARASLTFGDPEGETLSACQLPRTNNHHENRKQQFIHLLAIPFHLFLCLLMVNFVPALRRARKNAPYWHESMPIICFHLPFQIQFFILFYSYIYIYLQFFLLFIHPSMNMHHYSSKNKEEYSTYLSKKFVFPFITLFLFHIRQSQLFHYV